MKWILNILKRILKMKNNYALAFGLKTAIATASLRSLPLKVTPLTRLAKPRFYLQNPAAKEKYK